MRDRLYYGLREDPMGPEQGERRRAAAALRHSVLLGGNGLGPSARILVAHTVRGREDPPLVAAVHHQSRPL